LSFYAQQQQQTKHKALIKTITSCANNGSGLIRVTSANHTLRDGDHVVIQGVAGTIEANGSWTITLISSSTFDLKSSTFTNAYTSGGTVKRVG